MYRQTIDRRSHLSLMPCPAIHLSSYHLITMLFVCLRTHYLGLGGTLCVFRDDSWIPAKFYSRQLTSVEENYAILDLEAAALLATVEHFRYKLAGRFFKVFTDHRPLVNIIAGTAPSSGLTRWKIRLMEYTFKVHYIEGAANPVADAMSRQSWSNED